MQTLKQEYNTAIQLITHDLGVIAEMTDRVVVMYAGQVVEEALTLDLFKNTLHPYTRCLLQSIPVLGKRTLNDRRELTEIKGMIPSLTDLPKGCRFNNRCPDTMDICRKQAPKLMGDGSGHKVRCWLHDRSQDHE
jgi:oligopeptide/dipeptide ABC transporter ATP-binding protein